LLQVFIEALQHGVVGGSLDQRQRQRLNRRGRSASGPAPPELDEGTSARAVHSHTETSGLGWNPWWDLADR